MGFFFGFGLGFLILFVCLGFFHMETPTPVPGGAAGESLWRPGVRVAATGPATAKTHLGCSEKMEELLPGVSLNMTYTVLEEGELR